MKGAAELALLLAVVHLGCPCEKLGMTLVCPNIPSFFEPGCSYLFMSLQSVGVINSTAFKSNNLVSVTTFIISNAGITGIAENAFSSFLNLTDINLDRNMLSQINANWFGAPAALSKFSITGNQIEVVNASTLDGFTNLTQLKLNGNRIRTIHPNGFSSQSKLAEVDLSENGLTWVSPQVFRPLGSLRSIRLDGNPWNCSCDAEDFGASLKELHSRSQLDRPTEVTCETPPSLKGQPVWSVPMCPTTPPLRPPSMTTTENQAKLPTSTAKTMTAQSLQPSSKTDTFQSEPANATTAVSSHTATLSSSETSVRTKPTDAPTTVPESTAKVATTSPLQPSSKTEASVRPKPNDSRTTVSSHTATVSSPEASVRTKPFDVPTTAPEPIVKAATTSPWQPSPKTETSLPPSSTDAPTAVSSHTGTNATSPPPAQHTLTHLNPDDTFMTSSKPAEMTETSSVPHQSSGANTVCILIAAIAVLCVLLSAVSFLALLHRRKRSNKSVMPACPREEKRQLEDDKSLSHGHSENRDLEVAQRSLTGVRAKSANAVILTSPFGLSDKDPPLENPGEGEQKLATESEEKTGAEVGIQMDSFVAMDPVKGCDRREDGELDESPDCVHVNADMVPYLSIGTVQSKTGPDESAERPGERPPMEKLLGRISTWPPTAPQWEERYTFKEDGQGDWTQNVALKLWGEVDKTVNSTEHPTGSDQCEKEEEDESEAHLKPLKPDEPSVSHHSDSTTEEPLKQQRLIPDPTTVRQTTNETQETSPESRAQKSSDSSKVGVRKDPKRVATGRRRAGRGAASSQLPTDAASPDDETLLSGNACAFMDLLHEVSQNNGRWTRERWRQVQANRQRR